MNILILTESFPPHAGGSGWSTYYLCRALKKKGHNITVVKIKGTEAKYEEFDITNVKSKKELKKVISDIKPDLIHCQHRVSTIWGVENGVRAISTIRDYWHVSYDGTAFNPKKEENYDEETFSTVMDSLTFNKPSYFHFMAPFIALYLMARTAYSVSKLQKCSALICNSSHTYAVTKKVLPKMRCEIIPNLIDCEKLSMVPSHKFNQKTVLYVGKLSRNKGAHILINAALKIKEKVKYVFIGEGDLDAYIRSTAKENGINIEMLGYLPNDKVLSMMKGADILVLPALWNEPLGRTHLEGIGVGAKIITTDTGGTKDIIEEYFNGLFFDGTPKGLAKRIELLLSDDKMASNISKNAVKIAKERFDEGVVIKKFEKFYGELIK